MTWQDKLNYNPLSPLLSSKNVYIEYFTKRDLLDIEEKPINYIWMLDEPQKILKKQLMDGS